MSSDTPFLLQTIVEHVTDGIVVINAKGQIQYCNEAVLTLFGYDLEELLGESINKLIADRHRSHHDQYLENYLKTGDSRIIGTSRVVKAVNKNGENFRVHLGISETQHKDEIFFTGIFRDLHDIQEQTSQLTESQQRLNTIINTAVDGIITIGERGIIETINLSAAHLFGYEPQEVIGQNIRMLMPDPHHSQHDQYLKNYRDTGVKKIIGIGREVLGLRKDGQTFPFKLSVSEVKLKDKRIFTGIIHDISDRVRAEEVERALEKEKELNELKSRFVSIASHEFRTPLSTILSSASLIGRYESKEQKEKRNKHIQRIKNNVKHLTTILNDFLSLSKLEEGKIEHQPLFFDLHEFCTDIKEEFETNNTKNNSIHLDYKGDKKVFLDKKLLTHIIHNLLSNAIKYSEAQQVIEWIVLLETKTITITIKDEGIGIPPEEQNQLFERFFRAKNVSNIPGTGLGLNIVRKYIHLMDGTIDFHSVLNEGTSFTITFPNTLKTL